MSKIHKVNEINSQFVAPNRKGIEVPKELLTSNLCLLLIFSIECTKVDIISLVVA